MHLLRSKRTGIAYLSNEAEDAPLVVCMHGFPDIPRTWEPLTEALRDAGYHVVRPWLPGYAPSSLEGPFEPLSLSRTLLSFIEELSPDEPVRIVGHDWGSVIAQCAIAQWPERFRAAALLGVPAPARVRREHQRAPRSAWAERVHWLVPSSRPLRSLGEASRLRLNRAALAQVVARIRPWSGLLRRAQALPAIEHARPAPVLPRAAVAEDHR